MKQPGKVMEQRHSKRQFPLLITVRLGLVCLITLFLCVSCSLVWSQDHWVKGIWVRPNSIDPTVIQEQVSRFKQLGLTDIFLETYFLGKTAYPSAVMAQYALSPQHAQFRGYDVVQTWLHEAHQQGLKLHLWVQTYYAGNQSEFLDEQPYGPILTRYPQWSNRPYFAWAQPSSRPVASVVESGHYFLDPANPDVQGYVKSLLSEMIARYPTMDGLQLDYIRYPSSVGLSQANYLAQTWGYTDAAWQGWRSQPEVAEYLKTIPTAMVGKPFWKNLTVNHPLWKHWVAYRKNTVSHLVEWTSQQLAIAAPEAKLTTVVFYTPDPTKAQKCQDYPAWALNGWVSALVPIGLAEQNDLLQQQLAQMKIETQHRPIWAGNFDLYNRRPKEELMRHVGIVQSEKLGGVVFFEASRLQHSKLETLSENQ